MDENNQTIELKVDKFKWIREIIRANVISKLKGKAYANIIDIGANTGILVTQLQDIFPDSRFYAHPMTPKNKPKLKNEIKLLETEVDVKSHRYDLILSVFDIHTFNWLRVAEYIKFIHSVCDNDTTIIFSDIESKTITSILMLKIASLFNSKLKSIISQTQAEELLKSKGFTIMDRDHYKINDTWSAWILTCKKV